MFFGPLESIEDFVISSDKYETKLHNHIYTWWYSSKEG